MNGWASKLFSPLQGISDRHNADLDQFVVEVNHDQLEQMYYHKELDAKVECRPTFDQLSLDRIINETRKTLSTLKSLETILGERYVGFSSLNSSLLKARTAFEGFETTEGTLKLAADAFYIFSEQESTQSKQQIFLSDLKTSLSQIRHDAQKNLTDYQKEIVNAEKDVTSAEKKLNKSKESQEKGVEYRNRLESFELDGILQNVRNKARNPTDSRKDLDDMSARLEREVRDDIQQLLATINRRDQVLSASRRAFQKLNRDCKCIIYFTLRKIVDKEKDFLETRRMILDKFEQNVSQVDVEADLNDLIEYHRMEEGGLSLQVRALSLLNDLAPRISNYSSSGNANSALPSPSNSPPHQATPFPIPPSSSIDSQPDIQPSSKRSGSLLGGAFSAVSSMMSNTGTSSHTSSAAASFHLPTGTLLSFSNANGQINSSDTTPNSSSASSAPVFQQWEFAAHLSQVFYDTGETSVSTISGIDTSEIPSESSTDRNDDNLNTIAASSGTAGDEDVSKTVHRRARVQSGLRIQFHDVKIINEQEFLKIETNRALAEAVDWLTTAAQTKKGRDIFITELNQFRSRKVELGGGFDALGIILWKTLAYCQEQNDVHNSKIIMMLSQTFYRIRARMHQHLPVVQGEGQDQDPQDEDDEDEDTPKRGVQYREYIKEKLMGHPIWEDGNFWEQALWQCAIEQLQTIPYERPWYEMERVRRAETVRRVHDIIFSQVMAIIHSMMELGCNQQQTREFLYRMCVIHQLTEGQRQQLLFMILKR